MSLPLCTRLEYPPDMTLRPNKFRVLRQKGSVFIFTLWAITILSILAVGLGYMARQKITVFQRLRDRGDIRRSTQSAIKKMIGNVDSRAEDAGRSKSFQFQGTDTYTDEKSQVECFVEDEEARLNINQAGTHELKNLFIILADLPERDANRLAQEIIDYRDTDDHVSVSNENGSEIAAYSREGLSYRPKNRPFEMPEELLLVKGMTKKIYDLIQNYITIYGDGRLNINTCSRELLLVLELTPDIIDKVMVYRQSGVTADRVFKSVTEILPSLEAQGELSEGDRVSVTHAVGQNLLGVSSLCFRVTARVSLKNSPIRGVTHCVYVINDGIKYWSEI